MEIYIKSMRSQKFFIEIPVEYTPRNKRDGKKITIMDGIGCLYYLLKSFSKKLKSYIYKNLMNKYKITK